MLVEPTMHGPIDEASAWNESYSLDQNTQRSLQQCSPSSVRIVGSGKSVAPARQQVSGRSSYERVSPTVSLVLTHQPVPINTFVGIQRTFLPTYPAISFLVLLLSTAASHMKRWCRMLRSTD